VTTHPVATRRSTRGPRAARAGFTVLEVLLAMMILLIGTTAILSMLTFGASLARTAQLRAASAAEIEAVCADLEESFFPLLPDGTVGEPTPIENRPVPGSPEVLYSARATPNPDRSEEYRVDVELSWKSAGVQRTHRFTTILLREIPFGERMRRLFVAPNASTGGVRR